MELNFPNILNTRKKFKATIEPNQITVLIGHNGYGKSSFLNSLKDYLNKNNITYVHWNDMEYGRTQGRAHHLQNGNMEQFAAMAYHSEGESIMASFGYFCLSQAGTMVRRNPNIKEMYILIDQIDSGLDVHQINEIKNCIKDTAIPDMTKMGITVYPILTANAYETVEGEDCLDPVKGIHHKFKSFEEFKKFINDQYKELERKEKRRKKTVAPKRTNRQEKWDKIKEEKPQKTKKEKKTPLPKDRGPGMKIMPRANSDVQSLFEEMQMKRLTKEIQNLDIKEYIP